MNALAHLAKMVGNVSTVILSIHASASQVQYVKSLYSCEKSIVNALPKVVGFLRVLRFPPTGKVDWVG